jgi:hypothetical protein
MIASALPGSLSRAAFAAARSFSSAALRSIDSDGANTVVAAPDGGWLVGGSFSDIATFDKQNVKSKGGTDAMLVKLKATGDLEWVKTFGGKHNDSIRHMTVDAQGNIYVQGTFRDTSEWGGKPLTAGGAATDIVLAKYDLNGDHVWSQQIGNAFEEGASGIAVDQAGNITRVYSVLATRKLLHLR